jgi:hypothetical protein
MNRWIRCYFVFFVAICSCVEAAAVQDDENVGKFCSQCIQLKIDCNSPVKKISPLIYGIAFNARKNEEEKKWLFELNPSTRRWGGNPTSRYNWRINSWNTAQDWFFKNVRPGEKFNFQEDFLMKNNEHDVVSYVTLPMVGWVAKDSYSASYPSHLYSKQDRFDLATGHGSGKWKNKKIRATPETTSIEISNDDLSSWIESVNSVASTVPIFALGNEPMLWNHTHYDVHYEPAGYDEVFQKSLKVSKLVKNKSNALVAGPASWGWSSYFYSSLDMESGIQKGLDQRRYKQPFLEWYLSKFREYEERTGTRLLDALDIHYYPQAKGVFQGNGDPDLRWRSTKSLWDKNYVDESWINEAVFLVPRMKEIIRSNYPQTKLIIGEYSFGETTDVSGALAMAESLGTFAQHGVYAAYYWVYPKRYSSTYWGFRIFRNYDGMNSSFADNMIGVYREDDFSQYVSINEDRSRVTAVAINASDIRREVEISHSNCKELISEKFFQYNGSGEIKRTNFSNRVTINENSLGIVELKFKEK